MKHCESWSREQGWVSVQGQHISESAPGGLMGKFKWGHLLYYTARGATPSLPSPSAIYSPNRTAWEIEFFNGFFSFKSDRLYQKPPSFSLKMDFDNLGFSVSGFYFLFSIFLFCSGRDSFWCSHAPLSRAKPGYNLFPLRWKQPNMEGAIEIKISENY